jgi:hypothetical protein
VMKDKRKWAVIMHKVAMVCGLHIEMARTEYG